MFKVIGIIEKHAGAFYWLKGLNYDSECDRYKTRRSKINAVETGRLERSLITLQKIGGTRIAAGLNKLARLVRPEKI